MILSKMIGLIRFEKAQPTIRPSFRMTSAWRGPNPGSVSQHLAPIGMPVTASQANPLSDMSVTMTVNPVTPDGRNWADNANL
jgi:hypothetical protein